MFDANVYSDRRKGLRNRIQSGIVLFLGNDDAAMNYPANPYHFRQDSTFLYYFGLAAPGLAGVIDADEDRDILFGNDVDMEDIIWMGPQPTVAEQALQFGVKETRPRADLGEVIRDALRQGRRVHFLPPYRQDTTCTLESLLGIRRDALSQYISMPLIRAIIEQRSVKSDVEIREIEAALETTWQMHTTAMRLARPGVSEQEIAGRLEGIAVGGGGYISFPIICSVNGQILHNHAHGNVLKEGNLLLTDCGAETALGYAGDITRTVPVGGRFTPRQRDVYQIVLDALLSATEEIRPGVRFRDIHLKAAGIVVSGLKDLGLMKGDVDAAVAAGAHAMFFPHGLGHMMGLDVHDMEGLGETHVGYDEHTSRSDQFGLAYLRMARTLQSGFVMTVEPGIYFIPPLVNQWRSEGKHPEFIDYDKVETYLDFGGIRIEDDVLVTRNGHRVLGRPIPKMVDEIEEITATGL